MQIIHVLDMMSKEEMLFDTSIKLKYVTSKSQGQLKAENYLVHMLKKK